MKKTILKAVAALAEKSISTDNNRACYCLTYQPKAPKNIKNFKKAQKN